jgi:hypothetical protein
MEFRIKCVAALKERSSVDTESITLARTWLTAAELIDRVGMKRDQPGHYKKHQYLREVKVIPDSNLSRKSIKFNIILCPAQHIPAEERVSIKKELTSEYDAVKDYLLSKCKISLSYKWEAEK